MKYQLHRNCELYVPESAAESTLVRFKLQAKIDMVCADFQLWDLESHREGPWYYSSAAVPFIQPIPLSKPEARIVVVRCALPVENDEFPGFLGRLSPKTDPQSVDWLVKCLDEHVYGRTHEPFTRAHLDEYDVIRYIQILKDRRGFQSWFRRQPQQYVRHAGRAAPGGISVKRVAKPQGASGGKGKKT